MGTTDEGYTGRACREAPSHGRLDRRRLRMHRKIAEKVEKDWSILETAKGKLRKWAERNDGVLEPCLEEWEELLEKPWETIRPILTEDTEEGARLRQSTPFTGILTSREWKEIDDSYAT